MSETSGVPEPSNVDRCACRIAGKPVDAHLGGLSVAHSEYSSKHQSARTGPRPLVAAVMALSIAGLMTMFTVGLMSGAQGSSQAKLPTTVLLGKAQRFALLAGSGLTNTGRTTVNGDVGAGLPTPTETGFRGCAIDPANCVVLTGSNHVNDGVAFAGQDALTNAYTDAANRTPTEVGTQLGNTLLKSGVYNSADGTFQITGPLTLDAEGNPDAVFIFQTASTLTTAVSSSVVLVNGAQACNVFWKVGSSATFNATTDFVGTVMAHDDISVKDGVTVHGRLLAGARANHAGAVTLIHDTITRPTCAPPVTSSGPPTTSSAPPSTSPAPPTTQGSHGTSSTPGTGHTTSPGTGHTTATGTGTTTGTGATTATSATGPQVTNTPSGPVGTGDSRPPAGSGSAGGSAHYGLAALLLLAGTLCVVGVARLAQRSNR
jgi:Ice-binding-like